MNRLFISTAIVFGLSSLVLDSAIKGSAVLMLAAAVSTMLKRDSAATRHLVWSAAVLAMLVIPMFSLVLPQWQVLPKWVAISQKSDVPPIAEHSNAETSRDSVAFDTDGDGKESGSTWMGPEQTGQPLSEITSPVPSPFNNEPVEPGEFVSSSFDDSHPAISDIPAAAQSALPASDNSKQSTSRFAIGSTILIAVWLVVFCILLVRLLAARFLLMMCEKRASAIGLWNSSAKSRGSDPSKSSLEESHKQDSPDAPIVAAFEECCRQLNICQNVRLLIHPERTIPLVWGAINFRLLMPASAREWSPEQVRSVILHELAHIKRRDTIVQVLAQFACALHWFNPLAWYAAWRLHVEREGACDDLVLESGVRASTYAEHLLDVTTNLTPQRWTSACGLAMAANSPLESRLVAILSGSRNRRRVSATIGAIALMLGIGVAIPVSMLRGASDDNLVQGETKLEPNVESKPSDSEPNHLDDEQSISKKTERKLKWGKEVDGLRMALAWPPTLNEKGLGNEEEFFLVIQNVSDKAIRIKADDSVPNPRRLFIRDEGIPLSAFSDTKPMVIDQQIGPQQVVFVRLFHPSKKLDGNKTVSAALEGDVRQDPGFSITAEMTIEKSEETGVWTGKLKTGETRCSLDVVSPSNRDALTLYESWHTASRVDGKIPGGLIGKLAESVKLFIANNPTWSTIPQLKKMLPEFDSSRDWAAQDSVNLLDKLAKVQATPIRMALDAEQASVIRGGFPMPARLDSAPWGEATEHGLRHAWLWEPHSGKSRLGAAHKSRLLLHNSGKEPVVFRTRNWHQLKHQAVDADGNLIRSTSTSWTTRGLLLTYRLRPGEFVELYGPGLGIGPRKESAEWQDVRVGTWIDAGVGVKVSLTTDQLPLHDWRQKIDSADDPQWWQDRIAERLSRHLPFPKDKNARRRVLHRVAIEVLGTSATMDEHAAFAENKTIDGKDAASDAEVLEMISRKLATRAEFHPFQGKLQSGATQITVMPADPKETNRPRRATGPGRYTLGKNLRLVVSRSLKSDTVVNDGSIMFYPSGKPSVSHDLKLPKGYGTWSAAWLQGETILWLGQKGVFRKLEFADPANVVETRFSDRESIEAKVPRKIFESLSYVVVPANAPTPSRISKPVPSQAKPAEKSDREDEDEAADQKIDEEFLHGFWKGTVNKVPFNLSFHRPPASKRTQADLYIGRATIGMPMTFKIAQDQKSVTLLSGGAKGTAYGTLRLKEKNKLLFALGDRDSKTNTSELIREKQKVLSVPRQKEPRELYLHWRRSAGPDGKIDGKNIEQLAKAIQRYVKKFPNYHSSMELPKLLPRFDSSKDWSAKDVVQLLDDVAYYATDPIEELLPKGLDPGEDLKPSDKNKKSVDEYALGGFPKKELDGKGVMWSKVQDGLSLGYRVTGNRWRIGDDLLKVELWVLNSTKTDVKFRSLNRQDEGLRIRLIEKDGESHDAILVPNDVPLFGIEHKLPPDHCVKVNEFKLGFADSSIKSANSDHPRFFVDPGDYKFQCELSIPGYSAIGLGGKKLVPVDGEWQGKLLTRDLNVKVQAIDGHLPWSKPKVIRIRITKDGTISANREEVSLHELDRLAMKNKGNNFVIEADESVKYARVIEVLGSLKAAGIKGILFERAQLGDGKYRVANKQGVYKLDDQRRVSICRPTQRQHWFTVSWAATESWPKSWLKTYPNMNVGQSETQWAVVWEPGKDVLWWIDSTTIGKMTISDPARVIVDTEGRTNNFSKNFALPDGIRRQFENLGFVVGRKSNNVIGGNVGGRKILSADHGAWSIVGKVTDIDGNPIPNVNMRVSTNKELMTVKTDEKGFYRAYFSLPLSLLAHWRGVKVEPVLEGFYERRLSKQGEFNLLLHSGEVPQRKRIGKDRSFQPGTIPRFADRNLIASRVGVSPGNPGRADFVMLDAAELIGELVTADGKPAPEHWIAIRSAEQRQGHNLAIEKSDKDGRFRLKGIPVINGLTITVNPNLKPDQTTSSLSQSVDRSGKHFIKVFLPAKDEPPHLTVGWKTDQR